MTDDSQPGLRSMFGLVEDLSRQMLASADLAGLDRVASAPPVPGKRVILCGMGGSAIAGDLVQPLLEAGTSSLTVWRDYGLPGWCDGGDLVIASSYSGNTEETLSGVEAALERSCPVVSLSSGGALTELAGSHGFPVVVLPGGLPPRASLGYGLGALVRVLGHLGLVVSADRRIAAAARWLEAAAGPRGPGYPPAGPDPDGWPDCAGLASDLAGKLPVIFTAGGEAHAAGLRLKAQLNENGKSPALLAAFPELDHNDLVGWEPGTVPPEDCRLIVLDSGPDPDGRLGLRVRTTLDLLAGQFPEPTVLRPAGDEPLARIMSLVQYGDFLSCHLAARRGLDPVPVERIERLKRVLARGPAPRGSGRRPEES
ncbi:MAG: bifunctional phosphoglucose/phosphomannose isomerase [Candidatus Krumholzibacteriia bacterium]